MKPNILIRVDGGLKIGLGHFVRCSALAQMLKDDFVVTFFCKDIPINMVRDLEGKGLKCIMIIDEDEFLSDITYNSIVVLDGYHFDTAYQRQIKAKGAKMVYIDDLHDKVIFADLIINHSPGVIPQDYIAQPYTQFALGLDYALLRPAFLEQTTKQRTIEKIETIMICFGGSDYLNLTQSSLQVVLEFPQFKRIIVVTGPAYKTTDIFKQNVASDIRIDYRHALSEKQMLDAMLEADLAIIPASGILFEVLAAGCVAISGSYVDNQKLVYESFRNAGYIVDAGNFSYKRLYDAISKVSSTCIKKTIIIDGQTAIRISKLFDQLEKEILVKLRRADITDLDLTLCWATNPVIRHFSFQQHHIDKSEHTNWFQKKLMDPNCFYSIVEYDKVPIGSIRFDIRETEAMVSYLLDPVYHGQGIGHLILKKGIEWLFIVNSTEVTPISVISGAVMKTNFPSIKAFERLGFVKKEQTDSYKFEKWV